MGERVRVANLERAGCAGGPDVGPSSLDEIEVVGLLQAGHAIRRQKLGREAASGERFDAGRLAVVGQIDAGAAIERVEPVARSGAKVADGVAEQQTAVLTGARCGERHGLRGPLAGAGDEDIGPSSERAAQIGVVAREPIVLFGLRDGAAHGGRRQIVRSQHGGGSGA